MKNKLILVALALAVALPVLAGQRYNYGRNTEFSSTDTVFHRDQASLGWSVIEQEYTGTSPCYIYPKLDNEPELGIHSIGVNGTLSNPDYTGYVNTHNPCSGYDYYPYVNQSSWTHKTSLVSNVYVHTQQAREFAILLDGYQDVDRTEELKVRIFTDRGDYYSRTNYLGITSGAQQLTTTCATDANCPSGYACYPDGTAQTVGKCATDDPVGNAYGDGWFDGFETSSFDAYGRFIIFWYDGSENDVDGRHDYLTFSIHHEYGHYLHDQYGQSGMAGNGTTAQGQTWEMAAEAFGRLSYMQYMEGEGAYVGMDDKPAYGWSFSNAFKDGQQQKHTTNGARHVSGRAFGDAVFEIVYSVDCSELGASGCKSLSESGAALRDDFNWGTTSFPVRIRDVGRMLAYAMDANDADTPDEFADKFLYKANSIKGSTFCEEAEDVLQWHGFSGANCP